MRESLLSVHLDDEQVDDLIAALCAHRDHFVELIDSNTEAQGPQARQNNSYWKSRTSRVQDLIDKISDSLYGSRSRESE